MDLRQEIARKVDELPPDLQAQVLRFVAALAVSAPVGERGFGEHGFGEHGFGEHGSTLRQFASSLDTLSAREMIQAIEEECERVEAGEW